MKTQVDPLVENGFKVHLSYDNDRAFGRQVSYRQTSREYFNARAPTTELMEWMSDHCGQLGALWTVEKVEGKGIDLYFAVRAQAILFKLTWV